MSAPNPVYMAISEAPASLSSAFGKSSTKENAFLLPQSIRRAIESKLPFRRANPASQDQPFATNTRLRGAGKESDLSSWGSRISLRSTPRLGGNGSDLSQSQPRVSSLTLPSQALVAVLRDGQLKDRLRAHLVELTMAETLDCIDSLDAWEQLESDRTEKLLTSKQIMERFVLDQSPSQVNLSSMLKTKLQHAYVNDGGEEEEMASLFRDLRMELFRDMRQSDAFRNFMERDLLAMSLGNRGI
ncbi:hypothetical protein BASA81_000333 [Batrachochytrium salamandrivorans]|nr:hypothetical protein BASA81_000333 [Batrachochytrium salamandrivorans]